LQIQRDEIYCATVKNGLRNANAIHSAMNSAVPPQVRVEPELRGELEAVLHHGETLSEFVETSVRNAIAFRQVQTSFQARGDAAWEHYRTTGAAVPAADVLTKLRNKLDTRGKQLAPCVSRFASAFPLKTI
jgi:hypothetical protein